MKRKYSAAAVGAGCFWGFMGYFRRTLDTMGLSAMGVISVRCFFAAIFFAVLLLCTDRKAFLIKLKDIWVFFCEGVLSLLVFGWCYFKAMDHMSLSTAAILLYTAPCFVILMSALLFKEKMTAGKLISMAIAFVGCCFVSGIGGGTQRISLVGLCFGLGSGICYALYSIFSRIAINKGYSSLTINFYAFIFAWLGALVVDGGASVNITFESAWNLFFCVATGLITGFTPYLLYTYALTGIENGKASIMASIEPVVATVAGAIIYHERVTLSGGIGIALVLTAIVLLNLKVTDRHNEN